MIKACPEPLKWIVYEMIAMLGFYRIVLWGILWDHIGRGKPFFQKHHTYMYDTSLEASFQALYKTVFRLKIFPLEVAFFYLEMCLYEVPVCWMLLNQLIFWKIGLSIIQKTPYLCVSYINLTVISSSITITLWRCGSFKLKYADIKKIK